MWTASCADQTLVRIDPATNTVTAAIATPIVQSGEGQVAAGFGSIWISAGEPLRRLDSATNRFIATIDVPESADAVASGSDAIWVTVRYMTSCGGSTRRPTR